MKRFMITLLCLLAAVCPPFALCAQNLQMLVDGNNSSQVTLEDLRVDVKVTGSIAATTWTMVFRNNSSRLLEGELTFPLPEGITVSRYAIDINGKMREAVAVDKAKGTTVLEAIEQRRIDPGLLERVEGNAFRTRVYPLPAGGTRTVLVGYEEMLRSKGNKLEYRLPLSFRKEVPKVSIAVSSFQGSRPEAMRSSVADMAFDQQGETWTATKQFTHFIAEKPLVFLIPRSKEPAVLMQGKGNRFYALVNAPQRTGSRERNLPKDITILWDASLSGLRRNRNAELELLDGYLRRVATATVNLVVFSNTVQPMRSFTIKHGEWHLLREALEEVVYDGGTQPGLLNLTTMPGKEFLLFSDGLATYGKQNLVTSRAPLYCISSSMQADYAMLRYLAAKTGGQFIDLTRPSINTALEQLTAQTLQLLGIEEDNDIDEVYPNVPIPAEKGNSISAIIRKKKGTLTLLYGYGTVVTERKEVAFDAETGALPDVDLSRIWAGQKIAALDKHYEQNKAAIESLGKRFGLVTRNTSLIVLENLDDYVRYAIEPPAELREDYNRLVRSWGEQRAVATQNRIKAAETAFNVLMSWWSPAPEPSAVVPDELSVVPPKPVNGSRNAKLLKGATVTSSSYRPPIIDPENPGGKQVKTAEQIEKAPIRNLSEIAALSAQVYQGNSGQGLSISGSRAAGTKYIIDGVMLPPGQNSFSNQSESYSARFIDEAPPSFGIGERRRQKRNADELAKELAAVSKIAKLSDSLLLDSLFSYPDEYQYTIYLGLRPARMHNPSFFFRVASHFIATNRREIGLRVLSNLAELETENYEVQKMLAYKLQQLGETEAALEAFRKVLVWRPMDPQSRRDYGIALADAGLYQEAVDTLFSAMTMELDPSLQANNAGMEETLLCDINGILARHPEAASTTIPRSIIRQMPMDLRVVINWNTKATDIDLWIADPKGDRRYTAHGATGGGGRFSRNITEGFGPEQFLLRQGTPGRYKVYAQYKGDRQVKIPGPTTVMAEIYTSFGKPDQKRQIVVLQLKPEDRSLVPVGDIEFGSGL